MSKGAIKMTNEKTSAYQKVTDNIVSILEEDKLPPWNKEWTGEPLSLPYNSVTRHEYQGINIWNLLLTGWAKNYDSNQWATYKQWNIAGGKVKKGERSTTGIFFKPIFRTDDSGEEHIVKFVKAFSLFNRNQVEIDNELVNPSHEKLPIDDVYLTGSAAEMASSLGVKIVPGSPAYSPSMDKIHMPEIDSFTTAEAYFATMAHECSHATGHNTRLKRDLTKRFGSNEYAMEELIAELSAAYLCSKYNVGYAIEQHASYLKSWIKVLKEDNKAIFHVAAASQRAADYVQDSVSSMRLEVEQESELGQLMGA